MGGVTVTAARAERAFFSIPTFVDGKRPLCRREDRERFISVAAINQAGVRVVANPGSANEAFARANFTRADVTIHHDNASVFMEIVAGRADVMVTDGLEADHQARLHKELCAVPVAQPFTRLEKAYMFARDPVMKEFIDGWLAAAFASGDWQRALDRAMSGRPQPVKDDMSPSATRLWPAALAAIAGSAMVGLMPLVARQPLCRRDQRPLDAVLALWPGAGRRWRPRRCAMRLDLAAAWRGGAWRIALVGATLGAAQTLCFWESLKTLDTSIAVSCSIPTRR